MRSIVTTKIALFRPFVFVLNEGDSFNQNSSENVIVVFEWTSFGSVLCTSSWPCFLFHNRAYAVVLIEKLDIRMGCRSHPTLGAQQKFLRGFSAPNT